MMGRGGAAAGAVLVLLAACGPAAMPPSATAPSTLPLAAVPVRVAPVSLTGIRRGAPVGDVVFGLDCAPPYGRILWTRTRFGDGTNLLRPINDALTESGMTLSRPGGPAAPVSLTAEVAGLSMELCRRKSWLTGTPRGDSGMVEVQVAWTLAGPQGVIHRTVTTGRAELPAALEPESPLLEAAMAAAAGRLAADGGFRRALAAATEGLPPPLDAAGPLEPAAAGARGTAVAVGGGYGTVVGRVGAHPLLIAAGRPGTAEVSVTIAGRTVPGLVERTAPALGLILVRVMEEMPGPLPAFALSAQRHPAAGTPLWAPAHPGAAGLLADWRTEEDGIPRLLADLPAPAHRAAPGTPLVDGQGAALAIVAGGPGGRAGGGYPGAADLVPAVPVREALAALGLRLAP